MGTVQSLFRYPVKSMLGEPLDALSLGPEGVVGDRAFAVLDRRSGKVLSAKHPARWGALLQCRARYRDHPAPANGDPGLEIALPGGSWVPSSEPDFPERLGEALDASVALVSGSLPGAAVDLVAAGSGALGAHPLPLAADGRFVDYGPVHIVTTATLHRLGAAHEPSGHAARYRPNLVVAVDEDGFVENGWVGATLRVGAGVRLHIPVATPRCVVPTAAHGHLPADPLVLRTVTAHNRQPVGGSRSPCVGVYAEVVTPGLVRTGDPVALAS